MRQQANAAEEREWWDRAERLAAMVLQSPIGGALVGGAGGVLAHEPTSTSLATVQYLPWDPDHGIRRIVAVYKVENLLTHTLRQPGLTVPGIPAVQLLPATGWPDAWTVSVDFPYPGPTSEAALDAANRKLLAALRSYGFAAGSAFGLGMAAIAGLRKP